MKQSATFSYMYETFLSTLPIKHFNNIDGSIKHRALGGTNNNRKQTKERRHFDLESNLSVINLILIDV